MNQYNADNPLAAEDAQQPTVYTKQGTLIDDNIVYNSTTTAQSNKSSKETITTKLLQTPYQDEADDDFGSKKEREEINYTTEYTTTLIDEFMASTLPSESTYLPSCQFFAIFANFSHVYFA